VIVTASPNQKDPFFLVFCDGFQCKKRLECDSVEPLPEPWRVVEVVGWFGEFHACGHWCELDIQIRHKKQGTS